MKRQWLTIFISVLVLLSGALIPASAETAAHQAFKKQHQANKESDKAALARCDARVARRHGHSWIAQYDMHKYKKDSEKAYKHSQEAKVYRSIARHGTHYSRYY